MDRVEVLIAYAVLLFGSYLGVCLIHFIRLAIGPAMLEAASALRERGSFRQPEFAFLVAWRFVHLPVAVTEWRVEHKLPVLTAAEAIAIAGTLLLGTGFIQLTA